MFVNELKCTVSSNYVIDFDLIFYFGSYNDKTFPFPD